MHRVTGAGCPFVRTHEGVTLALAEEPGHLLPGSRGSWIPSPERSGSAGQAASGPVAKALSTAAPRGPGCLLGP